MKTLLTLTLLLLLTSCSDARRAKMFSFGGQRSIKCYSGGKLIYKGMSSGKISSEESSDGYYFKDYATGKLIEVSGDCLMEY